MPKASDIQKIKYLRILLYSMAGGGKTTTFRSLPGKKLLIIFDPAGTAALHPSDDIEYETFIPPSQNLAISSNKGATNSPVNYEGSTAYNDYEKYMDARIEEDYFRQFSWVGFDSVTSLQNIMLDQVANVYGREGRNPQLEDFGIMAEALLKNFRQWTALPTNIMIMAHEKCNQDKLSRVISNDLMVPGQYSKKICLLLSDIYHLYAKRDGKEIQYLMDVAPSDDYPLARCSLGFDPTIDVTIPRNSLEDSDITNYGFGKLVKEKGYFKTDEENETNP